MPSAESGLRDLGNVPDPAPHFMIGHQIGFSLLIKHFFLHDDCPSKLLQSLFHQCNRVVHQLCLPKSLLTSRLKAAVEDDGGNEEGLCHCEGRFSLTPLERIRLKCYKTLC